MLRTALIASLALAVAVFVVHYLLAGMKTPRHPQKLRARFPRLELLLFLGTMATFIALAVTGFYGVVWPEYPMHGIRLLVHVALGPAFAVGLAILAVMRAEAYRLGPRGARLPDRFSLGQKVCFWLFLLGGLGLIVTVSVSMMRVLEPGEQAGVIDLHRWSGLITIVAAVVYGYLAIIHRRVRQTVPRRVQVKETEIATS